MSRFANFLIAVTFTQAFLEQSNVKLLKIMVGFLVRFQAAICYENVLGTQQYPRWGGSPGLVVMGGDSRSKGRGFESRHQILDGLDIFSH